MENKGFWKVYIKNHTWYHLDDIFKLDDFDIDNTLKSHTNFFWFMVFHLKV